MATITGDDPMENPPPPPLAGLDPADLLRQGTADDTLPDGGSTNFSPPSIEELAPLFPRFEILALVGQGGMGAVYKVRQKDLDRIVALKILPPSISETRGFSERFTLEAKALAKLNHPGIVTIHEFGQTSALPVSTPDSPPLHFILMEYVDGVNLGQLMRGGRIAPREALAIVPQICDALQFAHDLGIVHRDIKPENILLDRHGRVKVADFGIAKVVAAAGGSSPSSVGDRLTTEPEERWSQSGATIPGKIMGTPQYMAPEQTDRPSEVDHRADIYALGVVIYQMLTGELPGKDLQAPSSKVRIDVRLDEIVMQAMEKKPELRYQNVSVLKSRMETVSESTDTSRTPQKATPSKRWIVAACLLAGLVGWLWMNGQGNDRISNDIVAEPDGRTEPVVDDSALNNEPEESVSQPLDAKNQQDLVSVAEQDVAIGDASFREDEPPDINTIVTSVGQERDVELDVVNRVKVANDYLDLVLSVATAKETGLGPRHPARVVNEKALARFTQRYADQPDETTLKVAAERLLDLEEKITRLRDGGIGVKHPSVIEVQRQIDSLTHRVEGWRSQLEKSNESAEIQFFIRSDEKIELEGKLVSKPALGDFLRQEFEAHGDQKILIRSAVDVPHRRVVEMFEFCRKLGRTNVLLASEPGKEDASLVDVPATESLFQVRVVDPDDMDAKVYPFVRRDGSSDELRLVNEVIASDRDVLNVQKVETSGEPGLMLEFSATGAERLAAATATAKGDMRLAILIDGEVQSAPVVQTSLRSKIVISGIKDEHERESLFAALPVGFEETSKIATRWLEDMDAGKYRETYEAGSELVKTSLGPENWQELMETQRGPLGAVSSRIEVARMEANNLPGVPKGNYRIIDYQTKFVEKRDGEERITLMMEKDGKWRVTGYFIK